MGLDNGIIALSKDILPDSFTSKYSCVSRGEWDSSRQAYRYEIAYWRKCWNVRDAFYACYDTNEDSGDFNMSIQNLEDFIANYDNILEPDTWDIDKRNNDTIWEWEQIKESYCEQLHALADLLDYIRYNHNDDDEVEVIFYDSW